MKKRKITVRDIAQHAHVSTATVSRAINGLDNVKPETLQRILSSANELGYELKPSVSGEKAVAPEPVPSIFSIQNHKRIILVHITEISNPFYSEIIKGIEASMSKNNFRFFLYSEKITLKNVDDFLQLINDLDISGIITLNITDSMILQKISSRLPIVQCCEFNESPYASSVGINDYAATQCAIEYFLSLGKTRIGIINGPLRYRYAQHRLSAFQSVLEAAGIEISPHWIIQLPDLNHDMAFSSVVQLLSTSDAPDCFFAVSDVLAAAAIRASQYCNLRVPEDIMIIGFDNTIISQLTTPSITTINQPRFQLGFLSGELLIEKMENPLAETKHMMLNTELVIRETTATGF